jgi:hypothetical protein
MKNIIVANYHDTQTSRKRVQQADLEAMLRAQIDNSLDLGWKRTDLIVVANFNFQYANVRALVCDMNTLCVTGSKMFAVNELYKRRQVLEPVWLHDLDAWQNTWFWCPAFVDVGICEYSRPKFNGGSVFLTASAVDIVQAVVQMIETDRLEREETALNSIFRRPEYARRITTLNPTFNIGCSGFVERCTRSTKPICVCHFHPQNRIAVETHLHDRNGTGFRSVSTRLESVLRRHFDFSDHLSEEGRLARERKVAARVTS